MNDCRDRGRTVTSRVCCRTRRRCWGLGKRMLRGLFFLYLFASLAALLSALIAFLRACTFRRRVPPRPVQTHTVPEWAFRQPDPLIYSQSWLKSKGLAYTWDNPDIRLELSSQPGLPVDAHSLQPDTEYRVLARIWNGSLDAPVAQLPVNFSYLDFGIGGIAVPIDTTVVDLPVKGAPGTPATAAVEWRTPATPGHYCLQVALVWPFDADPGNNLGQHNVDVKPLNSPRATFIVPIRNPGRHRLLVELQVDAYELPPLDPCSKREAEEPAMRRRRVVAKHGRDRHPVAEGWRIDLGDAAQGLVLEPGGAQDVNVTITAPDGFSGRKAFNLSGLAGEDLMGGVTLVVTGDADG